MTEHRPQLDPRIDAVLASRMSVQEHCRWWDAESLALGGLTPGEALAAGERDAVIELAQGRPGADWSVPLISRERGQEVLRAMESREGRL